MCSQSGIGDEEFPTEMWIASSQNSDYETVMWLREYPAVRHAIFQQQLGKSEADKSSESVTRLIGSSISSALLFASAKDAIFGQLSELIIE